MSAHLDSNQLRAVNRAEYPDPTRPRPQPSLFLSIPAASQVDSYTTMEQRGPRCTQDKLRLFLRSKFSPNLEYSQSAKANVSINLIHRKKAITWLRLYSGGKSTARPQF